MKSYMQMYLREEESIQQELGHCDLDFMLHWLNLYDCAVKKYYKIIWCGLKYTNKQNKKKQKTKQKEPPPQKKTPNKQIKTEKNINLFLFHPL
jgi:hypothetical protein